MTDGSFTYWNVVWTGVLDAVSPDIVTPGGVLSRL